MEDAARRTECGPPAAELAAAEPITKKAYVTRVNVPSQMRRRHDLGTSDADARRLVESALGDRPPTAECFVVSDGAGARRLTLQVWMGAFRVPPTR